MLSWRIAIAQRSRSCCRQVAASVPGSLRQIGTARWPVNFLPRPVQSGLAGIVLRTGYRAAARIHL